MTKKHTSEKRPKPLNPRQKVFARELGVLWAQGKRDYTEAYVIAGYRRDPGNAARLAGNPQVMAIANEMAQEAMRVSGLHMAYLQAQAMQLLDANVLEIFKAVDASFVPGASN